MQRYFIKFSYIGTQYSGMQRNGIISDYVIHDVDTIQGALECAFSTLLPTYKVYPQLTCSSRTDAGVHAFCNTAHINLHNKRDCMYNPSHVIHAVNYYFLKCNHNIKLLDFIPVTNNFHARKNAKLRTYMYRFMIPKNCNLEKVDQPPIIEKSHTLCFRTPNFDIERVKSATKLFLGKRNFETFSASPKIYHNHTYVRDIKEFTVEKSLPLMPWDTLSENFEFWHFKCAGKSFLYNQVRRMVTALLFLGTGRITEKDILCYLQVPNHKYWPSALSVVPPHGLHLMNVEYSQEEVNKFIMQYEPTGDETTTVSLKN